MVSLPFFVALSKRTSKIRGYILGLAIWAAAMLFSFLLGPANASFWVYVFAAVVGLGTGGIVVMIYAIFPDIPDVDELASGERREASYSALTGFIRKFSFGAGDLRRLERHRLGGLRAAPPGDD